MVRQMTSRNYLLLTPGPLTTSRTVKEAMLFDSCTWDDDYNLGVVQTIRQQLVQLATPADGYTAVLLQGSGSYAVEAVLGSVIGEQGKVLIVSNGAYGARMIEMAQLMGIACHPLRLRRSLPSGRGRDRTDPAERPGDHPYRDGTQRNHHRYAESDRRGGRTGETVR